MNSFRTPVRCYSNRGFSQYYWHLARFPHFSPQGNITKAKVAGSFTKRRDNSHLSKPRPQRIVIGVTGATGTIFAVRLLERLKQLNVETHLVMSKWSSVTLNYETDIPVSHLRELATFNYAARDLAAPISSGSFLHDGMIIVPCSMKTLAAVRMGFCDDLISRAADVSLKEGRKLMMVVRETPLSDIHLENMLALRRMGAIMFPPVPAFYTRPTKIDDLIDQSVGRMLDSFGIHTDGFERWNGLQKSPS
ncbi:Phenylacrylic acid decarboxylase 1, mitochondrial [Penicillium brasilianum]|uniref:Flavin prenyltransferase PAD1, mitochondrial n=1 Tax=Penicillium brasilianum TaxID=104259 RepID=A0A1S9RE30_PENBI|nr:Phenylacrylic acid decarboxylase 1, mitochondrial [Penicillium brasilianum]